MRTRPWGSAFMKSTYSENDDIAVTLLRLNAVRSSVHR
jgi:hypothetical protein